MSHFTTVVILPKGMKYNSRDLIEAAVTLALAPFDENLEVDEYQEGCWCVGREAQAAACEPPLDGNALNVLRDAYVAANKTAIDRRNALEYSPTKLTKVQKAQYHTLDAELDKSWQEYTGDFFARRKAAEEAHPMYQKPDPTCEDCTGSGKVMTSRNPKSKWDWWTIGGRWAGDFSSSDIAADKRNYERCAQCFGTGTRTDKVAGIESWPVYESGANPAGHPVIGASCNGCHGTGKSLKFGGYHSPDGDTALVAALRYRQVDGDDEMYLPFSVLTPDGEWHEKGRMGWWAMVSDEKEPETWEVQVRKLYDAHLDHVAVLCDLHI